MIHFILNATKSICKFKQLSATDMPIRGNTNKAVDSSSFCFQLETVIHFYTLVLLLGWTVIIGMAMLIYVITQSSLFRKAKYSKSGQAFENFYYKHKIIIISVITIFVISMFLFELIFIR